MPPEKPDERRGQGDLKAESRERREPPAIIPEPHRRDADETQEEGAVRGRADRAEADQGQGHEGCGKDGEPPGARRGLAVGRAGVGMVEHPPAQGRAPRPGGQDQTA